MKKDFSGVIDVKVEPTPTPNYVEEEQHFFFYGERKAVSVFCIMGEEGVN